MKKTIIVFTLILIVLISCQNNPEKILIGTWKLDSIETNQVIPPDELTNFNKAKQEIKASTFLTFYNDFSYKASIWGDTANGFWLVDNENMILKISDAKTGDTASTFIKDISSKKIMLQETSEGITSILTFVKD
jgi:hypothetical protein